MSLYVETNYVAENYTQDFISIDWGTREIFVPKSELTLVQLLPLEIRNMDINWFRLQLKDLEDSTNGMAYPDTHIHNTEVSLGGITFARVVQIINGYNITFEDGQYAVDLTGANSNIGDNINVNQVSVRSNNSAGLISSPDVEYSSFNGGVMIDINKGFAGTIFPTGTERRKSDNIIDTQLIAEYRGFNKIFLQSNIVLGVEAQLNDFNIVGHSRVDTKLVILESADVISTLFETVDISGVLDGGNEINNCVIGTITYLNGHIHDSSLRGTIVLGGSEDAYIANCSQLDVKILPVIDMGVGGQDLAIHNYSGKIRIENLNNSGSNAGIGLSQGTVILDSTTVLSGNIGVSGIGELVDENGTPILSGIWNNGVTISNRLINRNTITEASQLGDGVYIDTENGNSSGVDFPIGSKRVPVDNLDDAIIIAEREGINDLIFLSNHTFPDNTFIQNYNIIGQGILDTTFTFVSLTGGCLLYFCSFVHATLTGVVSGIKSIIDCKVDNLGSVSLIPSSDEIIIQNVLFSGTMSIPDNYSGKMTIIDSYSNIPGNDTPVLDLGNSTAEIQFRNYTGGIEFKNGTNGNVMSIDLISGNVKLDETVNNATITARGVGKMVESLTGNYIPSGIWNGNVLINNDIMSKGTIADAVLDTSLIGYDTIDTVADSLRTTNYHDYIHVDVIDGVSGTTYPVGTLKTPSNNIDDAHIISNQTGIDSIYFNGDYVFTSGTTIQNKKIYGNGKQATLFIFESGCILGGCEFYNGKVSGSGFGVIGFNNCHVENYSSPGLIPASNTVIFQDCLLQGELSVPSNYSGIINVLDSWMLPSNGLPPVFNMNGGNFDVEVRNLAGSIIIENCTQEVDVRIGFNAGGVLLSPSVTAGNFSFAGIGTLKDDSTSTTSLNISALIYDNIISKAVWDENLSDHTIDGTTGRILSLTAFNSKVWINNINGVSGTTFPIGTQGVPSNNGNDALIVAVRESIREFELHGNYGSTQNMNGYTIGAETWLNNSLVFNNHLFQYSTFRNLHLSGNGYFNSCEFVDSYIENITNINGEMIRCRLSNNISIPSGKTLSGVELVVEGDYTVIDLQNEPCTVSLDVNSGIITFINAVDGCLIELNLRGGEIVLDSTCVGGDFYAEGIGTLYDESAMTIIENHLLALEPITDHVWNKTLP